MRILLFNERLSRIGGSEIYVDRQARALRALGHEVVAICGEDDVSRTDSPFSSRYELPALFSAAFRPITLRETWHATRALGRILEAHKPDVALLHIFDSPIGLGVVLKERPTLRFVHTPWTYCPAGTRWLPRSNRQCDIDPGLSCLVKDRNEGCMVSSRGEPFSAKQKVRRVADMPLQAAFFRHSTVVCANTAYSAGEVVRLSGRSDNVFVLSPPVPKSSATERNPVAGRILFAGRITHDKGLADVVRAICHLPRAHLVVAGDGPEREAVATLAAELGVATRVEFMGWIDEDRLDEAMQLANLVVLPSLWAETFGLVGMQAAMNRRPVVAYSSGGIPDWLNPEIGIVVAAGDIAALSGAISRLLDEPALATRLGAAGHGVAQNFLPERHGERVSELMVEAQRRWQKDR